MLYFRQVYPIDPGVKSYFQDMGKTVIVEGNATAQFAKLLKLHADIVFSESILKYDGRPYSVEELTEKIDEIFS